MRNFLEELVGNARSLVQEGYYSSVRGVDGRRVSLAERIQNFNRIPIIAEIKPTSPSTGPLIRGRNPVSLAKEMVSGSAAALSVLTEPNYFSGSIEDFVRVRKAVDVPLLMKDVIVDRVQVDAAHRAGADAILLIAEVFGSEDDLQDFIEYSHRKGLEVLVEANTMDAFRVAATTGADMLGVNNRDLRTLNLDMNTSRKIAAEFDLRRYSVICESGMSKREEILEFRKLGYSGFLIGTSILSAENLTEFLRGLSEP